MDMHKKEADILDKYRCKAIYPKCQLEKIF
jgi:hypothetical protein